MDVLKNRKIDKVILLGSGKSILYLTEEEKNYINRCKYVIAINKFMAFYKKAGILPTHIYFHDRHGNSFNFYRYILEICKKDSLRNLTYLTNPVFSISPAFPFLYAFILRFKRKFLNKRKEYKFKEWLNIYNNKGWFKYPQKSKIINFEVTNYLKGGQWAMTLEEPIFHYRGSLTSVLNLCTIFFPGKEIFLVGTDFNQSDYFFEEEINQLDFEWKDFTHELVKKEGKHYSYQPVEGKSMDDIFPFILDSLAKTKNELYCTNSNSLLIKSGVQYKPLL